MEKDEDQEGMWDVRTAQVKAEETFALTKYGNSKVWYGLYCGDVGRTWQT